MQGHVPVPPQPHEPIGIAPVLGYLATREPQPLESRSPTEPDWLDEDVYAEEWGPRHPRIIKVTALVLSVSLVIAGLSTVLDLILAH